MPITACSGATAMPWPNAIVTVFNSPQWRGRIGEALSGSSVRSRSICPILRRNALCASTPCDSAIRAAPTFDEKGNTSFMLVQRPARIPLRVEIGFAGIQRHRHREGLEGRAQLVHAGGQPVDAVGIVRFL